MVAPLIGILALQGGVLEHAAHLRAHGAEVREVRTPDGLEGLDALVLPGGESTTMTLGIAREGLGDPLRAFAASGRPLLATCAGLILLDRAHLDVLPIVCERNAFGRQIRSFEGDVDVRGIDGGPHRGVFIRAPKVVEHDDDVEVLAVVDEAVVGVRRGPVEGYAFHPELTDDGRIHAAFVARVSTR
ncbi:pyridoxal 5'-phosphate synthase glutaminase subunit PdxT [Patulibacter sp. NPDC049589]|uniref:pyridoxal 5'-phosphate synthase glutaminase subunit PdxT n=1 Tax=Patulibacter sp. NPDC049589 TaxID=3154731 RepID=UPI00343F2A38